jgi:hypothetical protein
MPGQPDRGRLFVDNRTLQRLEDLRQLPLFVPVSAAALRPGHENLYGLVIICWRGIHSHAPNFT